MKSPVTLFCIFLAAASAGHKRRHASINDLKSWDYVWSKTLPTISNTAKVEPSKSPQLFAGEQYELYTKDTQEYTEPIPPTVPSRKPYSGSVAKISAKYSSNVSPEGQKVKKQSAVLSKLVYPESLRRLIPEEKQGQVQYKIIQHDDYDELKVMRRCVWLECGLGRQCVRSESGLEKCICAEKDSCTAGHRMVCGSDGNMYDSHCDLHRSACVSSKKIYVDHKGEACYQKAMLQKEADYSNSFTTKEPPHIMSKKKDLSQTLSQKPIKGQTKSVKSEDKPVPKKQSPNCAAEQFEEFKHLLRIYHCNRLGISKCDSQDLQSKKALVSDMFDYYDRNNDGLISLKELSFSQTADHIETMAHICQLPDFIAHSSINEGTEYIDLITFYDEFDVEITEKLEEMVQFDGKVKVTYVTANGYQGVELACGLQSNPWILWKRNGQDIDFANTNGMSLITNTKMYISIVNLDHTANYTCYDSNRPQDNETQLLIVQVKPLVRTKKVGNVLEGVTTELRCHVDGIPQPDIRWQVASYEIPTGDKHRYASDNENTTVSILSPSAKLDSANYQCVAKSEVGWSVSETDVLVQTETNYAKDAEKSKSGVYLVFHADGYTSYAPDHCYTTHSINKHASDFVMNMKDATDTLDRLCPYTEPCEWGTVANVRNKLVYVSQPTLNRIVVIDIHDNFRPKHVILLSHNVHTLYYLDSTDQLWILDGNQAQFQTVMILNEASQIGAAVLKPLLPEHSVFDAVESIYLPTVTSLNTSSRYAYTSHYNQHGLSRLDTVTLNFHGSLDLSEWQCQTTKLHHLAIGGLALVECKADTRSVTNLLVDVVTNKVIGEMERGRLYVSPNSRYIIAVSEPKLLTVYYLHDDSTLRELYNHTTQTPIGQVRFMQSKHSAGYDLAITSPDENSVIFMDLKTKQTELLQGLLSGRTSFVPTHNPDLVISTSGEFGDHLLLPSQGAMFIVNKQFHLIVCEWTDIKQQQISTWIGV